MPNPTYNGTNQPAPDNTSWFSSLGSLFRFGGATPAYAGAGQPTGGSSGFFGSGTPAYASAPVQLGAPAPVPTPPGSIDALAPIAVVPIESGALAPGQIAIVIPRTE
jgi:hypothetical protein